MQVVVQFPPEMMHAVAEGVKNGFIKALASSDRADHELICNAIRDGVAKGMADLLGRDLLGTIEDAVRDAVHKGMDRR